MAIIEETGALKVKDANGDVHIMYPTTKASAVDGLEEEYSKKSSSITATLAAASWSNGSYTLTVNGVTATSVQEILPGASITSAELKALQKANIQDGGQSENKIVLKAFGTVPSLDIPIRVILRGDM